MSSILNTVKSVVGVAEESTEFDAQLILHINSMINVVAQIGVGKTGFKITGADETWDDFLGEEEIDVEWVKSYIPLRVWVLFDSNSVTSGTLNAIKDEIRELETRFYYEKENWKYEQQNE